MKKHPKPPIPIDEQLRAAFILHGIGDHDVNPEQSSRSIQAANDMQDIHLAQVFDDFHEWPSNQGKTQNSENSGRGM